MSPCSGLRGFPWEVVASPGREISHTVVPREARKRRRGPALRLVRRNSCDLGVSRPIHSHFCAMNLRASFSCATEGEGMAGGGRAWFVLPHARRRAVNAGRRPPERGSLDGPGITHRHDRAGSRPRRFLGAVRRLRRDRAERLRRTHTTRGEPLVQQFLLLCGGERRATRHRSLAVVTRTYPTAPAIAGSRRR